MDRKTVFEKLTVIFRIVMDNGDIILDEGTTAEDIEEWDSLAHTQLVEAVQKEFGIKFSAYEIISWIDIGEMVDSIMNKIS